MSRKSISLKKKSNSAFSTFSDEELASEKVEYLSNPVPRNRSHQWKESHKSKIASFSNVEDDKMMSLSSSVGQSSSHSPYFAGSQKLSKPSGNRKSKHRGRQSREGSPSRISNRMKSSIDNVVKTYGGSVEFLNKPHKSGVSSKSTAQKNRRSSSWDASAQRKKGTAGSKKKKKAGNGEKSPFSSSHGTRLQFHHVHPRSNNPRELHTRLHAQAQAHAHPRSPTVSLNLDLETIKYFKRLYEEDTVHSIREILAEEERRLLQNQNDTGSMNGGSVQNVHNKDMGPVSLGSVSGPVSLGSVSGPVSLGSVSGPVSLGSVSGPVSLGSVSGPLSLKASQKTGKFGRTSRSSSREGSTRGSSPYATGLGGSPFATGLGNSPYGRGSRGNSPQYVGMNTNSNPLSALSAATNYLSQQFKESEARLLERDLFSKRPKSGPGILLKGKEVRDREARHRDRDTRLRQTSKKMTSGAGGPSQNSALKLRKSSPSHKIATKKKKSLSSKSSLKKTKSEATKTEHVPLKGDNGLSETDHVPLKGDVALSTTDNNNSLSKAEQPVSKKVNKPVKQQKERNEKKAKTILTAPTPNPAAISNTTAPQNPVATPNTTALQNQPSIQNPNHPSIIPSPSNPIMVVPTKNDSSSFAQKLLEGEYLRNSFDDIEEELQAIRKSFTGLNPDGTRTIPEAQQRNTHQNQNNRQWRRKRHKKESRLRVVRRELRSPLNLPGIGLIMGISNACKLQMRQQTQQNNSTNVQGVVATQQQQQQPRPSNPQLRGRGRSKGSKGKHTRNKTRGKERKQDNKDRKLDSKERRKEQREEPVSNQQSTQPSVGSTKAASGSQPTGTSKKRSSSKKKNRKMSSEKHHKHHHHKDQNSAMTLLGQLVSALKDSKTGPLEKRSPENPKITSGSAAVTALNSIYRGSRRKNTSYLSETSSSRGKSIHVKHTFLHRSNKRGKNDRRRNQQRIINSPPKVSAQKHNHPVIPPLRLEVLRSPRSEDESRSPDPSFSRMIESPRSAFHPSSARSTISNTSSSSTMQTPREQLALNL